jgi:hypothetical protein
MTDILALDRVSKAFTSRAECQERGERILRDIGGG